MLIKAKTTIIEGVAVDLEGNNDLAVGKSVILISGIDDAISGHGKNQTLTIAGTVRGGDDGIGFQAATVGGRVRVVVEQTGFVQGVDTGIALSSQQFTIVNHGIIAGASGINALFDGGGTSRIINTGRIMAGGDGVLILTDGPMIFQNSGRLIGTTGAYSNFGIGADLIQNSGFINGQVRLFDGDDIYDGRGGRIVGGVEGGNDDDSFVPGNGAETFDGGEDTDTLDLRSAAGVRVALDGGFKAAGAAARGDTYLFIENVLGSAKGKDVLRGSEVANDLRGFGGNDRLLGLGGADDLTGGAGRDRLSGGEGDDFFVFTSARGGADVITDFSAVTGNDDTLRMSGTGFGFGPQSLIAPKFFHAGHTNQAQDGNDRFIFRTGDETLWFDRDGRGGAGPVLIADFSDGVRLTAADFVLI